MIFGGFSRGSFLRFWEFCEFLDDGNKWALSFGKDREVVILIVRLSGLPAAVDDADPFVGEAAQDGVMALAFLFLLEVVGLEDRRPREFDPALAHL